MPLLVFCLLRKYKLAFSKAPIRSESSKEEDRTFLMMMIANQFGIRHHKDEVKKNQRHTTNKKPNMYKDINKDNQYFGL